MSCNMEWDNASSLYLIKLYESHRLLWDHTEKNYYNKSLKEEAWNVISLEMGNTVVEVKKKITGLMGTYRREKSREKKSSRSGRKDAYVSKWFAYDSFNFLSKKNSSRSSNSTKSTKERPSEPEVDSVPQTNAIESEETSEKTNSAEIVISTPNLDNFDPSIAEAFTSSVEVREKFTDSKISLSKSAIKRKAKNLIADNKSLQRALLRDNDDAYDTFGKHIVNELRKYDNQILTYVKKAINDIIFEADIGKIPAQSNLGYFPQQYDHHQDYLYSTQRSNSTPHIPSPITTPDGLDMSPVNAVSASSPSDIITCTNDLQ